MPVARRGAARRGEGGGAARGRRARERGVVELVFGSTEETWFTSGGVLIDVVFPASVASG